jgi:hypothetical protein
MVQGAGDALVVVERVHRFGGKGRLRDYRRARPDGLPLFPV